ncbi:hypothetical protein HNQ08_003657 [Deinococcus humi]|uniref:Uncharacterized protein n=1 Tax=Deinococcus humi TaxID=662880 RepID=A0A7W8NEN4_9DEIO|nr:hypothetical protein [Deinococcus humi]GGO38098.1 hypothetical protein GCM10008949_44230 [Deinococcus humi]
MPQLLSEQRCELDVPLAEGLVTDNNATLVQQFLDIALTEGKPVVEPEGVPNDAQGEGDGRRGLRSFTENQPIALNLPEPFEHHSGRHVPRRAATIEVAIPAPCGRSGNLGHPIRRKLY